MIGARARLAGAAAVVAAGCVCWPVTSAQADASGLVTLQTVPAVAGAQVIVAGISVYTDPSGSASVQVANLNGIAQTVHMPMQHLGPGERIGLGRVASLPHTVAHESHLRVGLNVWTTVHVRLRTQHTSIAPSSVTAIRLRSVTGATQTLHPQRSGTVELFSRRPQLVHNVLVSQPVIWSVAGVKAGPGVALTSAAKRFDPFNRRAWDLALQPVAGLVRITTVPATPNVQFVIEGTSTVTGANGKAVARVGDLNDTQTRVQLGSSSAGQLSVSLLKVRNAAPKVVHERELVAGLAVSRPVTLRFTDLTGHLVSADRISSARVTADNVTTRLSADDVRAPVMLLAAKATLIRNAWHVHQVSYAMSSAVIDGGQAVFAGQQHFQPGSAGTWSVKLSVFSVRVTTHDALLGTRIGSRLVVTRPNRTTYRTTVPSSGAGAVMTSVVRGNYDLHFSAAVLGSTTSLHISRSDTFDVRVVTPLDVALVAAVVLLLAGSAALGALHVARRAGAEKP